MNPLRYNPMHGLCDLYAPDGALLGAVPDTATGRAGADDVLTAYLLIAPSTTATHARRHAAPGAARHRDRPHARCAAEIEHATEERYVQHVPAHADARDAEDAALIAIAYREPDARQRCQAARAIDTTISQLWRLILERAELSTEEEEDAAH